MEKIILLGCVWIFFQQLLRIIKHEYWWKAREKGSVAKPSEASQVLCWPNSKEALHVQYQVYKVSLKFCGFFFIDVCT